MASLEYIVVEFQKEAGSGETSVEVVPETWRDVEGHHCFLYPAHYHSSKVIKAAKKGELPSDQWMSYPVLREWKTTHSWEKANKMCNKILETSNPSDSEEEIPRKRRRRLPARYEDTDVDVNISSDEEPRASSLNLPVPPSRTSLKGKTLFARKATSPDLPSTSSGSYMQTPKSVKSTQKINASRKISQTPAGRVKPSPLVSSESPKESTSDERMFTLLEKVIERLDRNEQLLLQIAERQQIALPVEAEVEEETVLPPLPCQSKEALQELNTLLENSHAARKKLTRVFSLAGGTGRGVLNNVLKTLIGHDISRKYNLTGTKGKKSFAELQTLLSIVKKGVRANREMGNTTESELAAWIGRWFTNARDRNGCRQERRQGGGRGMGTQPENIEENMEEIDPDIEDLQDVQMSLNE